MSVRWLLKSALFNTEMVMVWYVARITQKNLTSNKIINYKDLGGDLLALLEYVDLRFILDWCIGIGLYWFEKGAWLLPH